MVSVKHYDVQNDQARRNDPYTVNFVRACRNSDASRLFCGTRFDA